MKKYTLAKYMLVAKIGDHISTNANDNFIDVTFIEGMVAEIIGDTIRLKLDDGSFWVVTLCDSTQNAVINLFEKAKKGKTKKRELHIALEKENGKVIISLKIPEEVEKYYKSISGGKTSRSVAWMGEDNAGAKFYKLTPEIVESDRRIDGYTINNFGNGLVDGGRYINVAMLRTVGASKGVKISSKKFQGVTNAELELYVRRFGEFVKKLWEASISNKKIVGKITYEIEILYLWL